MLKISVAGLADLAQKTFSKDQVPVVFAVAGTALGLLSTRNDALGLLPQGIASDE